jgi:hypothetical protein
MKVRGGFHTTGRITALRRADDRISASVVVDAAS